MLVPWCEGMDRLGGAARNKGHMEVLWQSISPKVISIPRTAWGCVPEEPSPLNFFRLRWGQNTHPATPRQVLTPLPL